MSVELSALKNWYKDHQVEILKDYLEFLSFPSISADPKYKQDIRNAAEWVEKYLKKIGLKSEIWETSGHPVVFGSYMKAGPDKPTVLIYQHYDVQPVDPLELWHSDPFKPVVKNNRVYARGASDNKGQCFYSLNAIWAFLELSKDSGINIKVFIEGEEESGGVGTTSLLPQKRKELKADHLLIVDSDIPAQGIPAITLGIRGILPMTVECKNSSIDLHSGSHGGIALNPNRALIQVLAKLWDEKGRVTVPGFYDGVKTTTKEDLAKLDLSFNENEYRKNFGVKAFGNEEGYSYAESNGLRPTLEINGIGGGYTGEGFKTVIPAKAIAKISCRLVPGQDPEKIGVSIKTFLQGNVAKGIELNMEMLHGSQAYRSSADSKVATKVARAYEEVFEKPCRFLLAGGSIPIVPDLAEASGAQVALMGCALPEDNIHAPNEHFGLDRFEQGFLTIGRSLALLSE